jgi:hypothetical protein
MPPTIKLSAEDVTEMRVAATAAVGLFPRIEIDPAHAVELCALAAEALAARAERDRIDSIVYGDGDRNRGVSMRSAQAESCPSPKMNDDEMQCDGCGLVVGKRGDIEDPYCETCQPVRR